MAVSWDILLVWFIWNLFCYNQSLKLIKPGGFYTALTAKQIVWGFFFLLFSTSLHNKMLCFHESALIQTSRLCDWTFYPSLCLQAGLNLTHPRLKGVSSRPCFKISWISVIYYPRHMLFYCGKPGPPSLKSLKKDITLSSDSFFLRNSQVLYEWKRLLLSETKKKKIFIF